MGFHPSHVNKVIRLAGKKPNGLDSAARRKQSELMTQRMAEDNRFVKMHRMMAAMCGWPEACTRRQALVLDVLLKGGPLSARDVADRTGISLIGSRKLLRKLLKIGQLAKRRVNGNGMHWDLSDWLRRVKTERD
jgi:hypothetical protein